jgi:hypothetical protein
MSHFYNSESIFEVIGNYPVTDQFDILYANLQSGSYTDNYVTGALLRATKNTSGVGFFLTTGSRGLAFSKLGVDRNTRPHNDNTDVKTSYNLQPWRERAGVVRNIKIFSDAERFYDSLLPNLSKFFASNGIQITGVNNPALGLRGAYVTIGSATGLGILDTFPFEPKYSEIERVVNLSLGFKTTVGNDLITNAPVLAFDGEDLYSNDSGKIRHLGGSIYMVGYSPDYQASIVPVNYSPAPEDIAKVIFGFGDWNTRPPNNYYSYAGYSHYPTFRSGSQRSGSPATSARVVGPIIRGWKYGIFDGNPHYASCVFRRDRFGQFRDMLEQRLQAAVYVDDANNPLKNAGSFESPAMPQSLEKSKNIENVIERPVKVTFVKQQVVETNGIEQLIYAPQSDPVQTWSSNLSLHATSSLPFFDLENNSLGRNRSEIPSTVLNPEGVFTTP